LNEAMARHDYLLTPAPAAQITSWCTSVREQITSARSELSGAWQRVLDANAADVTQAVQQLEASKEREQLLLDRHKTVARTERVPGAVSTSNNADQRVLAYQAACH
jgi:hypothetical protein